MENKARVHLYISGRVQGVCFRYYTQLEAMKANVTGWVKNLWDARVEATFEGKKKDVQYMVDWCHQGPPGAFVKEVEVQWQAYEDAFTDFSITV